MIRTSTAFAPVLGPSLSNTLGLRDVAGAGLEELLLLLVAALLLESEMVFVFSTVTFRLIDLGHSAELHPDTNTQHYTQNILDWPRQKMQVYLSICIFT